MSFEPKFHTINSVLLIHEKQIDRFGGSSGVRDEKMLESAIAAPQASYGGEFLHRDIF